MMKLTYKSVLRKLNQLRAKENKYKIGTGKYIELDNQIDDIIFNNVSFKEVCLVGRGLNRDLTNKDCAKMIMIKYHHKFLYKSFNLLRSARMPLALLEYQQQTGLSNNAFANKYGVKQSNLSRMENCEEKVNPVFLNKVAKDLDDPLPS